jgi:hypothetical protein
MNARFPLTPALSLREREPPWLALREAEVPGFVARLDTVPPLPEGEGWGEGEQGMGTHLVSFRCASTCFGIPPSQRK